MALIKVFQAGQNIFEATLQVDKEYWIGRAEQCDIILNHSAISRKHAKLFYSENSWVIELHSKVGDLNYRGQNQPLAKLEPNDSFDISSFHFQLIAENENTFQAPVIIEHPQNHGEPQADDDHTHKMNVDQNDNIDTGDVDMDNEPTAVGISIFAPYLRIIRPNEDEMLVRLEGEEWVAGRSPDVEIFLDDLRASRQHFRIFKTNTGFQISDLETTNQTKINGNAILPNERISLQSGDRITVGNTDLYFELRDPQFTQKINELQKVSNEIALYDSHLPAEYNRGAIRVDAPYLQKKPRLKPIHIAFGIVALVAVWLVLSDSETEKDQRKMASATIAPDAAKEPYQNLPPEQQHLVDVTYNLAENLYRQGKYEVAAIELKKIQELIPYYKDSKKLLEFCDEAVRRKSELEEIERGQKEQALVVQKVRMIVQKCEKESWQHNNVTRAKTCLAPALELDPENLTAKTILDRLEQVELERENKKQQQLNYKAKVQMNAQLYERANRLEKGGHWLDAIDAYQKQIQSSLPDPNHLKNQSHQNTQHLRQMIQEKVTVMIQQGKKQYEQKQYRQAVASYQKALELDPAQSEAKERIDGIAKELNRNMKEIFSNSVLEENLGNVESAKTNWRQIMNTDLPGGNYYEKARLKLKKYGEE